MADFSIDDVNSVKWAESAVRYLGELDPYAATSSSTDIASHAWGINHRQTPLPIPINKDHYGLTFFTRPQLNFQRANLKHSRKMHPLLTTEAKSWQRYIRCSLDPRLSRDYAAGTPGISSSIDANLECPLLDENNAFLPLLTNSLVNISGWPDPVSPTYTSKSGLYKEELSFVDGNIVNYSTYDLTANFRNLRGNPIKQMFAYWTEYASLVFDGTLMPYPDMLLANEIDYTTRIYRLVLDANKTRVQHIGACGACLPTATPQGNTFDFASDKPYNDSNAEISIPFRAMGFIYNDDILIRSFNETVAIFNPDMMPKVKTKGNNYDPNQEPDDSLMTKVETRYLPLFNCKGYPRIDPQTYELQWYIPRQEYQLYMKNIANFNEYISKAVS